MSYTNINVYYKKKYYFLYLYYIFLKYEQYSP